MAVEGAAPRAVAGCPVKARRYRKLPIVIEAFVWDPDGGDLPTWMDGEAVRNDNTLIIATLEGTMHAQPGDYIIRGVKGEVYPCKPDLFEATYEVVPSVGPPSIRPSWW